MGKFTSGTLPNSHFACRELFIPNTVGVQWLPQRYFIPRRRIIEFLNTLCLKPLGRIEHNKSARWLGSWNLCHTHVDVFSLFSYFVCVKKEKQFVMKSSEELLWFCFLLESRDEVFSRGLCFLTNYPYLFRVNLCSGVNLCRNRIWSLNGIFELRNIYK